MGCQAGLSGTFAPQRLDQMVAPHGHPDMLGRQVIVNLVHIGDKEFGVILVLAKRALLDRPAPSSWPMQYVSGHSAVGISASSR